MDITPDIRDHIDQYTYCIIERATGFYSGCQHYKTATGRLIASAKYEDMYIAINELINKLERQFNKVQHKGE